MQEKVKQRLIGVIVIIGALFIILPFLFHNSRPSAESTLSSSVPASPTVSVALPTQTAQATQQTTPATQTAQTPSDTATAPAASTTQSQPTQTPDATAQSASTQPTQPTQPAQPAQTPDATAQSSSSAQVAFSASPNALTTGQANEGPAQPAAAQSQPTAQPAAPAKPIAMHAAKKHAAAKRIDTKKMPLYRNNNAWEIQLAVFSDKIYADNLVTKLRAHHFDVYSRHVVVNDRPLVAVFVGPEVNLSKAEMIKQRLKQEFQLNGVIRKYQA